MRRVSALILAFVLGISAIGAQVKFYASTDAKQVLENGVFRVNFILENARGKDFVPPDFGDLDIVAGPSTSMSTTIINGRRSSSRTYTYTLLATEAGKYRIAPASIQVDGKTMRSNELSIEVVEGIPGSASGGGSVPAEDELFLRAELDTNTVFRGQQVVIHYRLYSAVNVRNYNTVKEGGYTEFYYRYVQDFDNRPYTKVVNGKQFRVQTLRSVAVFPTRIGKFEVDPLIVNVGIGVRDERRSFFFSTRTIPRTLSSNAVNLVVLPLPEPAPPDFTGAVGHYRMRVEVPKNVITTDEALIVRAEIAGDGDAKRWSVPDLAYLQDRFEVYEPNLLVDQSTDESGGLRNRKVVEYSLIPKKPGSTSFTLDFVYFNPDSARYVTLSSRHIHVSIDQGVGVTGLSDEAFADADQKQLNGLRSPERLRKAPPVFIFSPAFAALCLAPWFFVAFVAVTEKRRLEYLRLDPEERKRREAKERALRALQTARELLLSDEKQYYAAITQAVFTYISGKLGVRASEVSKENIRERMQQAGLQQEYQERLLSILSRCEMVLYGAASAESDRQDTYDTTLSLITDIEETLAQ